MTRLAYAGARLGAESTLSPEIAEAIAGTAAEHGDLLPNIGADDRLAKASALLRGVVLPELDRRFGDFIQQITADLEDRAAIQRRALERHRDAKTASLKQQQERYRSRAEKLKLDGEERRAQQYASLVMATEGKLSKLRESCDLRLKEIEAQSEVTPEETDVANLFVELTD